MKKLRKRYIAFVIHSESPIGKRALVAALAQELRKNERYRAARPWVLRYENNRGLLRCVHLYKDDCIKLLRSLKKINGKVVEVVTLGTSGTIKRACNFLRFCRYAFFAV